MRSPSGGEARRRGGTQVGKAPPSPETTIFGLTRGQISGRIRIATTLTFPGSAGRCGPPLRRAVSFLGSASKNSAQITLRHRAFRTVALAPSSLCHETTRDVQQFWLGPHRCFTATPRRSRGSGRQHVGRHQGQGWRSNRPRPNSTANCSLTNRWHRHSIVQGCGGSMVPWCYGCQASEVRG